MPALESILEVFFTQLFSAFAYHAIVVLFIISLLVVVIFTGLSQIRSILIKTICLMGVFALLLFMVIVANIALENTEDRGAKRVAAESLGLSKLILRFVEQAIFSKPVLDEL